MEILLDVPPLLHRLLQWIFEITAYLSRSWSLLMEHCHTLRQQLSSLINVPTNAFFPLMAVLVVFWPILIYLVMGLAAAWGWILWLLTSIIFGMIQLSYVIYQFFMISCDICGLSILKTYSLVRAQVLSVFDRSGHSLRKSSQRRLWLTNLEQAGSYEAFLKIRIEPKQQVTVNNSQAISTAAASPSSSSKLLHRVHSLHNMVTATADRAANSSSRTDNTKQSPSPPRAAVSSILRNRSFSGDANSTASLLWNDELDPIVVQELGERTTDLLVTTTQRLADACNVATSTTTPSATTTSSSSNHNSNNLSSLLYLLSGVVKRNHLKLDDFAIENARAIEAAGVYGLSKNSRQVIRKYYEQVECGLDLVASSPTNSPAMTTMMESSTSVCGEDHSELMDRIMVVRKMKQNMGRTALMFSGGGAQAMYHLGIIRALIESNNYDSIKVISGTSGGSIIAAMCAIKTTEEMYQHICVSNISTDYGPKRGEQKRRNIRWFPSLFEMAAYWLKHKLLVDSAMFRETCEFYYSDITFEEAFERTGKHVCITVSASRVGEDAAQQRLLLNHISTPHVTLASAVAASCALPGVMAPAKLIAKNSDGTLEPFEVDGVEWIDGSVQADLPFQRISTLFAVSSFIVSQTNFHIVPLLNKAHHPNLKSMYWQIFQAIEWDIRSRALKLSRLGLFPKFFGQDISKVFKQRYHGNLTIVPRFTTMQTFGLKALSNPTVKDMEGYLKYGQIATWPYIHAIRDMIRLEKAIDDCLIRLEERMRAIAPELEWSLHDDIESIASGSAVASNGRGNGLVRILGRPPSIPRGVGADFREGERMRKRLSALEKENLELRKELEQLRKAADKGGVQKGESRDEGNVRGDNHPIGRASLMSDGSEGEIFGFLHSS